MQFFRILFPVCLLFSTMTSVWALDFHPGNWEFVVKQGMKGMPGGMGEKEWRECLTQANPIPTVYLQARNCRVLESHAVYRTLHYQLSCFSEHGTMTNEGKIHFGSFRMEGSSKSDVGDVAGENMVMRYKFTGRRIGDCN